MIYLPGRSNPLVTSSQAFDFVLDYCTFLNSYMQRLSCHQSVRFSWRSTFLSNCAIFSILRHSYDYGEAPDWPKASNHFRRQKTADESPTSRQQSPTSRQQSPTRVYRNTRLDTARRRRFVSDNLFLISNIFDVPRRNNTG